MNLLAPIIDNRPDFEKDAGFPLGAGVRTALRVRLAVA
jgi:hypothetical protein